MRTEHAAREELVRSIAADPRTVRDIKNQMRLDQRLAGNRSKVSAVGFATESRTLGDGEHLVAVNAESGSVTLTLPSAVGRERRVYIVKKVDATLSAVTIDAKSSETLDGRPSISTTRENAVAWVVSDGVMWRVVVPFVNQATETLAGVARIASQEETNTGESDTRIVTPLKLAARVATDTRTGLTKLATPAEIQNGAAGNLVPTAARLKAELDRRGTIEAWIAPVLLNGWVNVGDLEAGAGYRKTSWGEVQLKGFIRSGTATNGTTLFTLPADYRPTRNRYFVTIAGAETIARIAVLSDGSVNIRGVTNNAYLSLESVRFDV